MYSYNADCHRVESIESDPKTITITGPESVVNQASIAQAVLDVSGESDDFKDYCERQRKMRMACPGGNARTCYI